MPLLIPEKSMFLIWLAVISAPLIGIFVTVVRQTNLLHGLKITLQCSLKTSIAAITGFIVGFIVAVVLAAVLSLADKVSQPATQSFTPTNVALTFQFYTIFGFWVVSLFYAWFEWSNHQISYTRAL